MLEGIRHPGVQLLEGIRHLGVGWNQTSRCWRESDIQVLEGMRHVLYVQEGVCMSESDFNKRH